MKARACVLAIFVTMSVAVDVLAESQVQRTARELAEATRELQGAARAYNEADYEMHYWADRLNDVAATVIKYVQSLNEERKRNGGSLSSSRKKYWDDMIARQEAQERVYRQKYDLARTRWERTKSRYDQAKVRYIRAVAEHAKATKSGISGRGW